MAVSSSTDFTSTATTMLTQARRLLGISAEEEELSSSELSIGLDMFTRMLKAWEADGLGSWLLTEGSITLVNGTASYVCGSGGTFTTVPFEIVDARITRSSIDIPMERLARSDYQALPNKAVTGYPVQYFYDRQRDSGTLYVWPVPDVGAGTFKFTYRRRIMDLDAGSDNFDLPPEWEEAITLGLAKRLIPVYGRGGTPEAQQVLKDADMAYMSVKGWDTGLEEGSISILPDDTRRNWRRT
jgi:hypothetical protein